MVSRVSDASQLLELLRHHTLVYEVVFDNEHVYVLGWRHRSQRRQRFLYRSLADIGSPRLGCSLRKNDRARYRGRREARLAALGSFNAAPRLDIEHENAADTGFAVATNLASLQFRQLARDEES